MGVGWLLSVCTGWLAAWLRCRLAGLCMNYIYVEYIECHTYLLVCAMGLLLLSLLLHLPTKGGEALKAGGLHPPRLPTLAPNWPATYAMNESTIVMPW